MPYWRLPLAQLTRSARVSAALALVALSISGISFPSLLTRSTADEQGITTKANPSPKSGYEVEFRFAGLPEAPSSTIAFARFEVGNLDCVPIDYARAPGGVRLSPEHKRDLPLERRTDGAFVTTLYEDALSDTDLFGRGTCHWRMDSVTLNFRSPATLFVGGATADQLRSSTPNVQHFLVRDFFDKPKVGEYVFGEKADHFLSSLGPQFTLTTTARRLP